MEAKKIRVKLVGDDAHAAYVALPGHQPLPGIVKKMVSLDDLVPGYKGPTVNLDFGADGLLIGIEILA